MESASGQAGGFHWAAATDVGRVRRENQDAWLVAAVPGGVLLAVADGMGGHPNGAWASKFALDSLATELATSSEPTPAALAHATQTVNRRLRDEAVQIGTPGAGTTLVAVVLTPGGGAWVNVGDSRCYVLEPPLRQVTRDHNLAAEPGGHPALANVLTRSIGPGETIDPDTGEFTAFQGVVLATDGLYGLVPPASLQEALAAPDLERACHELVRAANRAGGHDNITVVLARPAAIG